MNPVPLPVRIAGVGAFLPALRVSSAELEARLGLPDGWVEHVTGVRERRYAVTETTVEMGAEAARRALIDAGRVASDLDLIVAAMSAPAQAVPCTAAFLQRAIGAPGGGSACFDVNATCLSFIAAIQTVAPLIASGVYRTALVVSSELPSRSLDAAEPDCAVLFGDAAAAVVLERAAGGEASTIWHTALATWSEGADLTEFQGAGTLHHPNDPMTTREMNTFRMRGTAVFKQAARLSGPFLDEFFEELGWSRSDVAAVVPHQASRHALEQLTGRLGFDEGRVLSNIAERGNCVGASIPLLLAEAVQSGRIVRGDRVLLCGTGAGLTLGAVALTY